MKLTKDEVSHVAKLSNLELNDQEIEKFANQLGETLDYINTIESVDTKDVEPTHSVTGLQNVIREDEAKPSLTQEQALQNTKNTENGYFKVKAIFEE